MWRWWWRGVVLRREVHNGPDALEELVQCHVGQGKLQHASAGLTTHRQVVLRRGVHNGPDTLEELVERHVARGKPQHASAGLTTHRREALSLYREILRASQLFIWTNEQGVPWRDLLCESARHEFEQARNEKDPEVIARLLVVGRDAVHRTLEKESTYEKTQKYKEDKFMIIFTKAPQSVISRGSTIKYPHEWSELVDYESELAVIINRVTESGRKMRWTTF